MAVESNKVLAGQVALITGCGRPGGMGEAAALRLASEGADVVVTDQVHPQSGGRGSPVDAPGTHDAGNGHLDELASRIGEAGRKALAIVADISQGGEVQALVDQALSNLGCIDILVNCAASTAGTGPFLEIDEAAWDRTFAVNTKGPFYTMRAVIPGMLENGGGRIVNILTGIEQDGAGYGAYLASKAALATMSRITAYEFASRNVLINTISPGWITTSMGREEHAWIAEEYGITPERVLEVVQQTIPRGRDGSPKDIADAIFFLCSPLCDYMVGQNLDVDGGYYRGSDAVAARLEECRS